MKILQEEKNYWAAQCLEAREQVERVSALADTYLASYEGEEKARKELEERFDLLYELMGIMQRTGYTTTVALNRITAEGLREHCKRAEEYVRPKGRQSKIDRKDLVLIAWRNNTNGSFYPDERPLGVSESLRLQRIRKKGEKTALCAIDQDHAEE
ncbi:putative DNA ligase [Escherichia phage AV129]|nr:putative DNA ligase [Escherichia phage AV129]